MTDTDGAIDIDYKGMWEDEKVKIESLTNELTEAKKKKKKKIESLQQSTAAKIPEKPVKAAPKRPTKLRKDSLPPQSGPVTRHEEGYWIIL
jgi:Ser-tRNA(Ala) deacylase AlaX